MPLSAQTILGPYEILAPLGSGGMGEVYRARDIRLGREVAIKVLPETRARDPGAILIAHICGMTNRKLGFVKRCITPDLKIDQN